MRTNTVWNAAPLVKSPSKTNSNADVFHCERVPLGRRRLEDRVDRAERDAEDDVERQQEEDAQPDDAGQREAGPEAVAPALRAYAALVLRHPP